MNSKIEIKAWWWQGEKNLGDVLTPYIIERLSGIKCHFVGYKWTIVISYIIKQIKNRRSIKKELLSPIYFSEPQYILGVGSILGHLSDGNSIVWGSGFLKENQFFSGKRVLAVRGRYSSERLMDLGFPKVDVLGDPALLLPLIYRSKAKKKDKIAIIPHYSDYSKFKELYNNKIDIISMRSDEIEKTIDQICSYKYLLSSSLHGIIIGQAYNIPVIWIERNPLDNDSYHFKFRDYFSSVGIDYYEPFRNIEELLSGDIEDFFLKNKEIASIQKDISLIQHDLLKVAPFPLLPQFAV